MSSVLLGILLRTIAWETAFQIAVRNCSKEVKYETGYIGAFLFCFVLFLLKNITHVVEYQKIAPNHERQTLKDFSAFLGKMQECGLTEMISRDAS